MPSKDYNGQNPLGEKRSQSFAQVELQVGRLQPALSLQSGSLQTPNGRIPTSQKFVPASGAANPWKVSLTKDKDGAYTATVSEGKIYAGLLSLTKMVFDTEGAGAAEKTKGQGSAVVANDVVCILYTYADGATPAKLELSVFPSGVDFAGWEYKDENEEEPPKIIATRYPLAKILDTGETDADNNPILQTEQMASNNLALIQICFSGNSVTTFTPY